MKKSLLSFALPIVSSAFLAVLLGCAGMGDAAFPPSGTNPEQVQIGPLNGSVFGGHAPLVGAHVYLLQATTNGYGAPAVSLLTANSTGTSSSYPVAVNTSDPIIPKNSSYYFETTDSTGSFNLTGDYTCSTGANGADGPPVYIYAYGGSPTTLTASDLFTANQIVVSGTTGSGTTETATYTFTVTNGPEHFTKGEVVALSGFTGTTIASLVNGQSAAVLATNLTTTTFAVTLPDIGGQYSGTYSTTGTVTAEPNFNPAVVNVAVLGNCPATKNFAGTISFIYLNEVSTVAAANALAGFTSSTLAQVNALNIGTSSTNLQGLLNAGLNANQLYDIQGSVLGTGTNGEGHIARLNTPVGSGVVSQALIDAIANTLAACVDSANTATAPQAACTALFATATADGTAGGVKPIDTATAAFNIAHNPHSGATNYARTLFQLPTGVVPFSPTLSATPANFAVSITYSGGGLGASQGGAPHSVAIDGTGNVWVASSSNALSEFSPLGVAAVANGYTGEGMNVPTSVAVDAASNYVWVANYGAAQRANGSYVSVFTTGGQPYAQYVPGGLDLQDVEFDSAGNAWVTGDGNNVLTKLSASGAVLDTFTPYFNIYSAGTVAIQPTATGNVVFPNIGVSLFSAFNQSAQLNQDDASYVGYGVAIDAAGKVWTTSSNNGGVVAFTLAGNNASRTLYATGAAGGTAANPGTDGIAIDGANSVWATSSSSGTIYQLSNTGTNLSGTAGYSLDNAGGTAGAPDGIAIDGSGNVWFNTTTDATLRELVGSATPVVTPIAAAVKNNTLGQMP
jgi:hypothetical protein